MSLVNKLSAYVADITGELIQIHELPSPEVARAPLFLRTAYRFFRTTLFNRKVVLALQLGSEDEPTPSEYGSHLKLIRKEVDEQAILVLSNLPAYARNRLVRLGVPFIVPGKQMFLPTLLIDLRERFPKAGHSRAQNLSRPGQVVLLYYLLGNTVEGISLRDLAQNIGYSAMTMSNVRDELEAAQLCEVKKHGRSTHLVLGRSRQDLWKKVRKQMRSPIQKKRWICWMNPNQDAYISGISALSHYTPIADDNLPTYAMYSREYRKQLETGDIQGCHGPDEADAQLETWAYDPSLLASGRNVDPLSLYLGMRDILDERVVLSLQGMLQSLKW